MKLFRFSSNLLKSEENAQSVYYVIGKSVNILQKTLATGNIEIRENVQAVESTWFNGRMSETKIISPWLRCTRKKGLCFLS